MIVDTHCHASQEWFEPVETLLFQMDRAGVAQAILVQMLGQYDNQYQQGCVHRYPDRLASVVAVDLQRADAEVQLRQLHESGEICGLRLPAQSAAPESRVEGVWRLAETLGLVVSCVGQAAHFATPGFAARLRALPRLRIVLEHLGGIGRPDFDGTDATRASILALSGFNNVFLKVPGLGQLGRRKPVPVAGEVSVDDSAAALLQSVIAAFGPDRLMWGSDFPPVASREGYANALNWPMRAVSHLADADRTQIFGGLARTIFGLSKI